MKWLHHVPAIALIVVALLAIFQSGQSHVGLQQTGTPGHERQGFDTPATGAAVEPAAPRTAYAAANSRLPMSDEHLANGSFEQAQLGRAAAWAAYAGGYSVDGAGGRQGRHALRLVNRAEGESHGARQVVTLNQTTPRPLYFAGWSKAEVVSGITDSDYGIYVDVNYVDGTTLWGQALPFDTGTHDWQFREGFIVPAKPIKSVSVHCLLRRTHSGSAWFDELTLREVQIQVVSFDSTLVTVAPPTAPAYGGASIDLRTGDGLGLSLASVGGAVTALTLGDHRLDNGRNAFASGFLVRDMATQSDFVQVGGLLTEAGDSVVQRSALAPLGLGFTAVYTATADRIGIHAELADTTGHDRAVTLYFTLPIAGAGWTWGDDIRTARQVSGVAEFANLGSYTGLGATGRQSRYPWASLSGSQGGIALALPLTTPRIFRLVYNPAAGQFYAAFDLGLSLATAKFPGRASVDLILYRFAASWGFRAAAQGYYERFPAAFARRIPPEREGIWVAFSDLSPIPNISDFCIAFHEIGGLAQVPFDESAGILSFRYVSEPWSHWLPIEDPSVDPSSYGQVVDYLREQHQGATESQRRWAEATLSSGLFDENGRYRYRSEPQPWCSGVAGCAVFTLNPDPDIHDPDYPLNKAHLDWNEEARQEYTSNPGLDGAYVDSFLAAADLLDFRLAHFAATDTPLTYRTGDRRLGLPEVFATTEFARWLGDDVHRNLGKWTMANAILTLKPWGADLFDCMGEEVDWLRDGHLVPDPDAIMNYRRTLSGQRPYGLLLNTDFSRLSYDLVERYFQVCLFYGMYPSMFSQNGARGRYWDDPGLYNRDRPLFRRYIPLIRRLNDAGWQSVTQAWASDPAVHVERFGAWPRLHLSLRNTRDVPVTVAITLDAGALGLPARPIQATALLAGKEYPLGAPGAIRQLAIRIDPQTSEVLYLH